MVFSSPLFLFLFFPALMLLHVFTPQRFRNYLLLVASIVYYVLGKGDIIALLLGSIAVNYAIALWMDRSMGQDRLRVLALGVFINLSILGIFKYTDFVVKTGNTVFGMSVPLPEIVLPLGISFFTFHALSYLIDIYRRNVPAQRNPFIYGLYILLFPQLIAGPIIRYKDIAAQFTNRVVTQEDVVEGVRRFLVGLGKKVLIANTLGVFADRAFAVDPGTLSAPMAWFGLGCYTLQIYHDFSGYSDMAIGLCRMFGFRILENFNYPYIARSVREFWRRWHISLSNFFRDYLYIPLGGNRRGKARTYLNMVIVFFLCGLWHGANWTFVCWGLFHGIFIATEHALSERLTLKVPSWLKHLYLLLAVMIGWVLFRAADFQHAAGYYRAMLFNWHLPSNPAVSIYGLADPLIWTAFLAGALGATPWWRHNVINVGRYRPLLDGMAYVLFIAVILRIASGSYSPFIYFNF